MAKMRNIIKSSAEYTETFTGFRGIAPEGDNTVKNRLAYCENVFRDYEGDTPAAIVSVPGYRRIIGLDVGVQKLFAHFGNPMMEVNNIIYLLQEEENGGTRPVNVGTVSGKIRTLFPFEEYTYFLDGTEISRLHKSAGKGAEVEKSPSPYVPILYLNGKKFESRNLLTDVATEEYDVIDGRENTMESELLRFSILDADTFTCAVSGADVSLSGDVYIPGFKKIGGVTYRVEEISDKAFYGNESITSVHIGEGVRRIGKMAFYGCSAIKVVSTPTSLHRIEDAAFNSCISLTDVYLRSGLYSIGESVFAASLNLRRVHYEGNANELANVEGSDALSVGEIVYVSIDESLCLYLPLYSGFETVDSVTVDGMAVDFETQYDEQKPIGVILSLEKHWQYNGSRVSVRGTLPELLSNFNGSDEVGGISGRGLIESCTVCALYDGRVFLTGSPRLPATVFYCSRTRDGAISPLYFGEHNYFNDGSKSVAIRSLLSVGNGLYVLKGENDQMGSIFLHKGEDTGIDTLPRIYPVYEAYSGDYCLGATFASADAPLFLSPRGLCSIEKQTANLERSIAIRSSNVTSRLLGEKLSSASILGWMGYVAVCCGSRIYLADTRATFVGRNGNTEYEWFIIDGVGAYLNKKRVFRYCAQATNSASVVKPGAADEVVQGTPYTYTQNGKEYHFIYENKQRYAVYPTEEFSYSGVHPAEEYCVIENRLYFTANGGIFLFNNDKRSAPVSAEYLEKTGITEEEYRELYGRRLHPTLYNFDEVAPRYVIRTVKTDCGVPHLTKSSVKSSLTIKLGRLTTALPSCKVTTDKGNYSEFVRIGGSCINFLDMDFSRLSLVPEMDQTVSIAEKEKDWIEKDVVVYSEATSSPISVHGISFRYKIKGRIKHT